MSETRPDRTSRLRWLLFALLAWTVLAAIPTSSAYIAEGSHGFSRWLSIFGKIAPYYYMWAVVTPLIYRLSSTALHPGKGWPVAVTGHVAVAFTLSAGFGYVLHLGNWQEWLIGNIAPGYYAMSAFSYIFIVLGIYLYNLQKRVRQQDAELADRDRHALRLEADLARSQVELLRGQMNPHFLFNALNCIGALIETRRNDRAYEALEDLGGLLRTSLEHRNQALVPLRDELAFCERYVAMEQVRFGDRLKLRVSVDSAAGQWLVPPFVLQPLIENVVKHAVAPSHEEVTVQLDARRVEKGIRIQVTDDGAGASAGADSGGTGVGLENLSKRLELLFGDESLLTFEQNGNHTRVSLVIPERKVAPVSLDAGDAARPQLYGRLQTQG